LSRPRTSTRVPAGPPPKRSRIVPSARCIGARRGVAAAGHRPLERRFLGERGLVALQSVHRDRHRLATEAREEGVVVERHLDDPRRGLLADDARVGVPADRALLDVDAVLRRGGGGEEGDRLLRARLRAAHRDAGEEPHAVERRRRRRIDRLDAEHHLPAERAEDLRDVRSPPAEGLSGRTPEHLLARATRATGREGVCWSGRRRPSSARGAEDAPEERRARGAMVARGAEDLLGGPGRPVSTERRDGGRGGLRVRQAVRRRRTGTPLWSYRTETLGI
jgi:hypothetical protein